MAAIYQLVYDVPSHYNRIKLMYSLTVALTVSCCFTEHVLSLQNSAKASFTCTEQHCLSENALDIIDKSFDT